MKHPAYCFGTPDGKYLVVRDYGHAAIVPQEEAFNGKRTLLVYTSNGKARQALATRKIYSAYEKGIDWFLRRDHVAIATKEDLVVLPMKLTLDI